MTHVSASPPFHPGRSDFPSPVGDLDHLIFFPHRTFPITSELKCQLTYAPHVIGLSYGSTPARDSSRFHPVDLFRCPSRPRAPLPLQDFPKGCDFPRHLGRHYPPLIAPTGSCARPTSSHRLRIHYSERSLQVAVSPCWILALPDIISTILA
jgi:hypothetical protein